MRIKECQAEIKRRKERFQREEKKYEAWLKSKREKEATGGLTGWEQGQVVTGDFTGASTGCEQSQEKPQEELQEELQG